MKDLTAPRRKVIAPYPNCPFEVGDILIFIPGFTIRMDGTPESITYSDVYKSGNNIVLAGEVDKCTANFRKMFWWEDRKEEEMPEFLKYKNGVYKVAGYFFDAKSNTVLFEDCTVSGEVGCMGMIELCYPATLSEYTTYKSKQ